MAVDDYLADQETRTQIDGVPGRLLMGVDADGNKRFLRCDENGFLLCKVAEDDSGEIASD